MFRNVYDIIEGFSASRKRNYRTASASETESVVSAPVPPDIMTIEGYIQSVDHISLSHNQPIYGEISY